MKTTKLKTKNSAKNKTETLKNQVKQASLRTRKASLKTAKDFEVTLPDGL